MKPIVVYSSKTGNTERLAKAIHEVMPEGTELKRVDEIDNLDDYNPVILGYFVEAGSVDRGAKPLLESLKDKKVGLFATTGLLFLGGKIMTEAKEQVEAQGNELICSYICPGRIDPKVETMFKNAFPKMAGFVDDARQPEDVTMPLDTYLDEARKMFSEHFGA